MLDMIIKGARVVTPSGVGEWDVGISGEKIAAVGLPGLLPEQNAKIINAAGKIRPFNWSNSAAVQGSTLTMIRLQTCWSLSMPVPMALDPIRTSISPSKNPSRPALSSPV